MLYLSSLRCSVFSSSSVTLADRSFSGWQDEAPRDPCSALWVCLWPAALRLTRLAHERLSTPAGRPITRTAPPGKWVTSLRLWDYELGDECVIPKSCCPWKKERKKHQRPLLTQTGSPSQNKPPPSASPLVSAHERRHSISTKNYSNKPPEKNKWGMSSCTYTCVICRALDELFSNQERLSINDI